jgi:hypothetical protein
MKWTATTINSQVGRTDAIAPEIISASRSTDIPAHYAEWFFNRLNSGYVKWINPFNRKSQYISFENTKVVIFWSKNPKPLVPYLHILDERQIAYYFQFTVNDYEEDGLEPGVPPLSSRLDTFKSLSDLIGPEKVIWRFDPLILTSTIDVSKLVDRIGRVGEVLSKYTSKLVFSFADVSNYKKVRDNLKRNNVLHREFTLPDIELVSHEIAALCRIWSIPAFTCGESVNLSEFGIHHNKCIDDNLILKITNNHPDVLRLFGLDAQEQLSFLAPKQQLKNLKDTGQRDECGCIMSKDIGQYNTCPHRCVYCYANTSDAVVAKNLSKFTPECESIIPE